MNKDTQIYLDMDGVLSDLDSHYKDRFGVYPLKDKTGQQVGWEHVDWEKVRAEGDFFITMPKMPDADNLVYGVLNFTYIHEMHDPIVLTGINKDAIKNGPNQKREWIQKHYPGLEVIPTRSEYKSHYCKVGDVLIDDWLKYKHLWEAKGGIFIQHVSAVESLMVLRKLEWEF